MFIFQMNGNELGSNIKKPYHAKSQIGTNFQNCVPKILKIPRNFHNFYSTTTPIQTGQKSRNQKSTSTCIYMDPVPHPCPNRPEKQKSEIYFQHCLH
jgi:hypothetical protein